ncbi:TPR-like protein [Lactifluus subvellereus]|nr:TPR-like protein [Lactifluus subvellereus]
MALNEAQGPSKSQSSFQPADSLNDVDSRVHQLRIQASALPFRHPDRAAVAHDIANCYFIRYKATRQKEDLDQAIVGYGEALLRGFDDPHRNIFTFKNLTRNLHTRSIKFGAMEDLDHIISYYRHLCSLPLDVANIRRIDIILLLAMALRSRFEVDGRLEDIEDSISLLRQVITTVPPGTNDYRLITSNLAISWERKYERTNKSEHLTEAIIHYRAALTSCPLGHPFRLLYLKGLAHLLNLRFDESRDMNDIEDAATLYQELLDIMDKDPDRMSVLMDLANAYHSCFEQTDDPEDLEKAISRYREVLLLCPPDHEDKGRFLGSLAASLAERFEKFGRIDCLKEAISLFRNSLCLLPRGHPYRIASLTGLGEAMSSLSSRTHRMEDLEESINLLREVLALTPPGDPMRPLALHNLSVSLRIRYTWTYDLDDIDKAIEYSHEATKLLKSGHPGHVLHNGLAAFLSIRFHRRGAVKDITDAIKHHRTSISLIPEGHPSLSISLSNLACDFCRLFLRTGDREHLEEFIGLFRSAVEYPFSVVRDRLKAAMTWTDTARHTQHPSALSAYREALSLLQRFIDLGPTVETQHENISSLESEDHRSLPMNAASYAIESGAYQEAVEMLEQGRALLWSSMRSLRTPLEHLRGADKVLADELTEICQALEAVITTTDIGDVVQTPAGTDHNVLAIGSKDSFSRNIVEKRRLSEKLEAVVLRVQALPGFENFWRPVPFRHLRMAAAAGPVVIINLSEYRSDILIVRSSHPVVHIPTPTNFFDRVTKLTRQLSETRKNYRLESKQYDRVLRQTLEELYELVGKPVVNKLTELGIPEQSRIWLCPTSSLTSLPIHAAGPIPSHTKVKRYLCDIYVCSYTPSLSAMIASRSHTLSASASGPPSLLIVGQPDESLPGVDSETLSIVSLVGSGSVTSVADKASTPEEVIAGLPTHPWVHFACHGVLKPGRPFESSFLLQHNTYLSLLRIAKVHLPMAELAFLAACHTAELTEGDTPDEVLHLTAAMQFSGFRSVIGTMWAMADEDGQELSEYFYRKMFSADAQVASYEESARALRHAIRKLRAEKRVSLERWVNFVHYGA